MSAKRKPAVEVDCAKVSDDAQAIAEGWTLLPTRVQRYIKLMIDDHMTTLCPILRPLYHAVNKVDQRRADAISERVTSQYRRKRGLAS